MDIRTNLDPQQTSAVDVAKRRAPQLVAKRITDIVVATVILVLAFPCLVLVAIAICADSRGGPLFTQKRIGKDGKVFNIYKFRTMFAGTPDLATDLMVQSKLRTVTRVGDILRKTSLDELPQLINILKGDMSLVGPRPALYNQYELTEKRLAAGVLTMPPGITGWAQINGRDDLSDEEKVSLDAWYCQRWHYLLDWQIIIRTFGEVLGRRGAK